MGLCAACQATRPPPAEGLHLERPRGAVTSTLVCTKGHRTEVSTAETRTNPPRECPVCAALALLKDPAPDPELDAAVERVRTRLFARRADRG